MAFIAHLLTYLSIQQIRMGWYPFFRRLFPARSITKLVTFSRKLFDWLSWIFVARHLEIYCHTRWDKIKGPRCRTVKWYRKYHEHRVEYIEGIR